MLSSKKRVDKKTPEELKQMNNTKTSQQWIPVIDISNGIVYRKDGNIIGALRVQPLNIELLSDNEKRRKVDALSEGLNGENEGLQIFCIGRPVDLNNYLEWLQDKAKNEHDFMRKRLLKNFIQVASNTASSGETIERRFYIIISKPSGPKSETDLIIRLNDLKSKFAAAELDCSICQDDELIDLFSLFANPIQASLERTIVEMQIPPVLND